MVKYWTMGARGVHKGDDSRWIFSDITNILRLKSDLFNKLSTTCLAVIISYSLGPHLFDQGLLTKTYNNNNNNNYHASTLTFPQKWHPKPNNPSSPTTSASTTHQPSLERKKRIISPQAQRQMKESQKSISGMIEGGIVL